jgi:hypothetical protein
LEESVGFESATTELVESEGILCRLRALMVLIALVRCLDL